MQNVQKSKSLLIWRANWLGFGAGKRAVKIHENRVEAFISMTAILKLIIARITSVNIVHNYNSLTFPITKVRTRKKDFSEYLITLSTQESAQEGPFLPLPKVTFSLS